MPAGDAGLERQTCEVCREIDRLQAQLAAQQAVVDAARELGGLIDGYRWSSHSHDRAVRETNEQMRQALAALDKAQTAQLEGEPR